LYNVGTVKNKVNKKDYNCEKMFTEVSESLEPIILTQPHGHIYMCIYNKILNILRENIYKYYAVYYVAIIYIPEK
jgi:hypothetical protein